MVCYVGLVYPRPRFGLLSRGEVVRGEPAQYISMRAPETTVVVPNGSHYRDSQYNRENAALKPLVWGERERAPIKAWFPVVHPCLTLPCAWFTINIALPKTHPLTVANRQSGRQ